VTRGEGVFGSQLQLFSGGLEMKRFWRSSVLALAIALSTHPAAAQDKPEVSKLRLAVGGKSAIFYLPLSVTERLGYFKDAGLEVEIADVQSGARALQSLVGGSAEIGIGTFDHTIQMQAKSQPVVAVTQYGRYPGFVLGTIASKSINYVGPQSLKGLRIGVTSPGSSTHFMAAYMLVRSGLKADDASFVGTGVTSTAVAAARRGEIDAIVSSDPMMSLMQSEDLVKVVADTRTLEGTKSVYGGPYPGGVVYTTPAFIEKNPRTVQAVVTAFVRALKWMAAHSAEDIAKAMPEEYALGNRDIYVRALVASRAMYSPDGRFVPGAAETAHQVLKVFDPSVAVTIDLTRTYTGAFVDKALAN
jgi:NitT/TauT family transport system substrate-binding protein